MKKYYYKVYGLNIESEIIVPELTVLEYKEENNIDVKISYGIVKKEIKNLIDNGVLSAYSRQNVWFHIPGVGTYHIYNGDTVIIEPSEVYDKQLLKVYIIGSVLGIILFQKDIVAIHGGSICINNKGCVFTGEKGAGKSTLTTALRKKGYSFISDDVGTINSEKNKIIPGFGYQKLCEDTMSKFGYDISKYTPFRGDLGIPKYIVPAIDSFINYEADLKYIFELEISDISQVQIVELKGNEKLQRIIKNIFRIEILIRCGGMNTDYFRKCLSIAKDVKFYKILRPKYGFTVSEQINLIENIIYNKKEQQLKRLG